jgi:hypothetical protein
MRTPLDQANENKNMTTTNTGTAPATTLALT